MMHEFCLEDANIVSVCQLYTRLQLPILTTPHRFFILVEHMDALLLLSPFFVHLFLLLHVTTNIRFCGDRERVLK